MMKYKPRLTEPATNSKYWLHTSKGGYNKCILIKGSSCLPNCVGYAWGRWYELLGKEPKLSRRNAENWYGYTKDGYKRGNTPKLGAVICFRKGKVENSSDGAGHVAVVEEIKDKGVIIVSQSSYGGKRFTTRTLKPPYSYNGLTFQGFIYPPISFECEEVNKEKEIKEKHVYHTVKKGDNLWNISKKYLGSGFKYKTIKKLNNLKSNTIYPGQKLRVK